MTLVVNLFAAPGSGKSTLAAGLFYNLKSRGINCEIPGEYAKVLAWSNRLETIKDQFYVFGKQHHRIWSLKDKVDVIIADSPIVLGLAYAQDYPEFFKETVLWAFNQYDNINFLINRTKEYNPAGRFQTEQESLDKQIEIVNILNQSDIEYDTINGDASGLNHLTRTVLKRLNNDYFTEEN